MNVQELGDANIAFARDEDVLDEIARVTGLSHRTVVGRVNKAHGGTLVRTLFGPDWPSEHDELGLTLVRDAGGGVFVTRLARATGLRSAEVRERLAKARPNTQVKNVFRAEWFNPNRGGADEIGSLTVTVATALGLAERISEITGLEERTVARRMAEAHGGTLVRNLFERAWPEDDWDDGQDSDEDQERASPRASQRESSSPAQTARRWTRPSIGRGTMIAGRYELKTLLGSGGFGEAWKALDHQPPSKPTRVLKFAHTKELADSLWTEMEKAFDLTHPNICKLSDIHHDDSTGPFLVYAFAGQSLAKRLPELGPRKDLAQTIATDIAKALDYAHSEHVIHHDVSPGNILIGEDGKVRLTDFGIAKSVMARETTGGGRTQVATSTSNAFHRIYVAPEVTSRGEAKPASDQYSLALVVCSIFAGHVFERPYAFKPFPKLSKLRNAALERALEMNPRDRFPSCTDFAKALSSS